MPFELGLDFGCRYYGSGRLTEKVILVLEEQRYRYQATISDLAGSDIEAHHGKYQIAVRKVRNWLVTAPEVERIGATQILADYELFQRWHFNQQSIRGFSEDDRRDYSMLELLGAMQDWYQIHVK